MLRANETPKVYVSSLCRVLDAPLGAAWWSPPHAGLSVVTCRVHVATDPDLSTTRTSVRPDLLGEDQLAAAVHVVHHLLLQQGQLVPEHVGRGNQLGVLSF